MDSDKSAVECPKCGHKVKIEHYWKGGEYLDETYEGYSYVLSNDNKKLEPSTALYEKINFNGVEYHVMRRFHFSLEKGEIVDVRMAKCIIAGLCKVRGSILLYENDEGAFKTSRPCNASDWFTNYKYREIQCKNFLFDDDDEKSFGDHLEEVSEAHNAARRYYKPTIAMARELIDRFPVNENLSFKEYGSELEVNDSYFVHRIFRQGAEKERWYYSYEDNVNAVMEFSDGEWVVTDTENPYDYHDDIFLYNKEKVKGSFVDKLGLFCVVEDKRDEFNRMMRDSKAGKVDRIFVKSVSRFARNSLECIESVRELKKYGTTVIFENDGIDTKTMNHELILYIKGAFAQAEAMTASMRVRRSNQMRMENGEYILSNAPFGYKICDGTLEPIWEEVAVVRKMFKYYLSGMGFGKIAQELNNQDVPGKPWGREGVRYILSNEKYIGDTMCQKTFTPYCHRAKG